MTRAEQRRELTRKKSELRAQLARARRAAQGRVDGIDLVRRARRRKRAKQAVGLAILVALLLMIRCDCGPAQPGPTGEPEPMADSGAKPARPPPSAAMGARVTRQPRAVFTAQAQEAAGWLDEFRLQVAARSPRLAQCFTGAERPGAVRWSVALNPSSGAVFDHQLELVGPDPGIEEKQRACVEQVLSSPAYALAADPDEALARRVSLVIEF